MFQPKSNQQWQCIELESEHTDNVLHSVKTGSDHFLIHSHRLLADLEIAPVHQSRQGDAMVDALDGSLVEIFEIVKEGFPKLILVTYKSLLREDVRPFLEGRVHRFGNCVIPSALKVLRLKHGRRFC